MTTRTRGKQVVLDQLTIDIGIHSDGLVESDLDLVLLCRAQVKAAQAAPRWCRIAFRIHRVSPESSPDRCFHTNRVDFVAANPEGAPRPPNDPKAINVR